MTNKHLAVTKATSQYKASHKMNM